MGESPFCSTAHMDTLGGVRVLSGPTVTCNEGEVAFTFIDNAVQSILGQRRARRIQVCISNNSILSFGYISRFSAMTCFHVFKSVRRADGDEHKIDQPS